MRRAAACASMHSRSVAVQVEFERHILKPVFHLIGSRVETRRLSGMGQGESTCTAPPQRGPAPRLPRAKHRRLDAAVQVECERKQILKPGDHFMRASGVKTVAVHVEFESKS